MIIADSQSVAIGTGLLEYEPPLNTILVEDVLSGASEDHDLVVVLEVFVAYAAEVLVIVGLFLGGTP